MVLSTASRRFLALLVTVLLLTLALAPISASIAGPGNDGEPIPTTPPGGGDSTGSGMDGLLGLLDVIVDVGIVVVL